MHKYITNFKAEIVEETGGKETTDTKETTDSKDTTTLDTSDKNNLDTFKNRRIAVVGIESKEIDETISGAIVDFIINAFVNEGTMKVVDRNSIEKILSEQEFQAMDFTDTDAGRVFPWQRMLPAFLRCVTRVSRICLIKNKKF